MEKNKKGRKSGNQNDQDMLFAVKGSKVTS